MKRQSVEARAEAPLYLYAIVPARIGANPTDIANRGADRLCTIPMGRFAVVAGKGPGVGSLGWGRKDLVSQLVAHQQAMDQIMQAAPLLPVKFGTFVPDETTVRAILRSGAEVFEAAFGEIAGCVQVEILVRWNIESVFAEISAEKAIAELKNDLARRDDAASELSRAALGRLVKDALNRRRTALAATLTEALQEAAVDSVALPATSDQVVLQLALLIKPGEMPALERCMELLDADHDGKLNFRCVGPLAPYSFATVDIEIIDGAALAQARCLLDVAPNALRTDVRTAYRRLAKNVHPDRANPNADGCPTMAALTDAYRILSRSAKSAARPCGREQIAGGDSRNIVDDSVFVSIRRQERAPDAPVC